MNKPIEYIKGFCEFLGCRIDLSLKPMIPRPETEFWLKKAIKQIKSQKSKVKSQNLDILDIFAGSGCIGIAILKNCPEQCRRAVFSDIDKNFLKQIRINLKLNKIPAGRYKVIQSDIFGQVRDEYDYIFANPPYVGLDKRHLVQESVLDWEPLIAIFGGEDGLLYIRKFLKQAKKHLKKNGKIYLEFDYLRKKEIGELLSQLKYKNFKFFKDQFHKWRYVIIFGKI